jgi:Bacterial archaeo-eukaryotic release factor family 7
MTHIPSRSELRALMEQQIGPCISLFLPAYRAGAKVQQNPLRLRNLIREAEHHLLLNDLPIPQVEALLEPARELLGDELFWLHPDDGLAIFRSPNLFRTYWLPDHFKEQAVVTHHFFLKPLLHFLTDDGQFYLLALSHNHIRLIEGTRYGASEVTVPETVPRSLAEAMRYDESENELQYHSGSSGGVVGKGGRRATLFHGQGVGTDDDKEQLLRYFQQIDRGLHAKLGDEHAPLVLAGVAYLFPLYRQANTYPHLLEEGVPGNPDKVSLETLRQQAWTIVEPFFAQARQEALTRYRESAAIGRASHTMREIVLAAYDGRIESLFIEAAQEQWGTFNPTTRMLHVHLKARFNDDDLLDVAATQTLLHGGSIYMMECMDMPDEGPLAAVLRY